MSFSIFYSNSRKKKSIVPLFFNQWQRETLHISPPSRPSPVPRLLSSGMMKKILVQALSQQLYPPFIHIKVKFLLLPLFSSIMVHHQHYNNYKQAMTIIHITLYRMQYIFLYMKAIKCKSSNTNSYFFFQISHARF